MSQLLRKRSNKLADSEAVRLRHLERRAAKPLILSDLPKPQIRTILQSQLDELRIDEKYQRLKVGPWVNTLIHVLLAGGDFPAPAVLSRRPDGSLYIVDGQQRYWAAVEAKRPLPVYIYEFGPNYLEIEMKLFQILNAQRNIRADFIVHGWPGESGDLMRKLGESPSSPLYGQINFSNNTYRTFGASVLLKTITLTLSGKPGAQAGGGSGDIQNWCGQADELLRRPGSHTKAEAAARLLGEVFGQGKGSRMLYHVARAFAAVMAHRWRDGVVYPSSRTVASLRRTNWSTVVPSGEAKFIPVVISAVERKWPSN